MRPGRPQSQILRLVGLGWQDWADALRAVAYLARARAVLGRLDPGRFRAAAASGLEAPACTVAPGQIERIGRAIGRASRVVPWRSDCLVQAEAGRRWIAALGGSAEIRLGARKAPDGRLDAHAWLVSGGRVVTGGDITRFVPFD